MNITRIGLDLAKNTFQVHAVDSHEHVVVRRTLKRDEVLAFFRHCPSCLVGMEACGGAHYWGRQLQKLGHTVRLIPPQFVKPYVKHNKNDARDAEAICEALSRPTMHFVPVKSVEQQTLCLVHQVRREQVAQRTAKVNQIRGLLAEFGLVLPRQIQTLRRGLPRLLEDAGNELTDTVRALLDQRREELVQLDACIEQLNRQLKTMAITHVQARRLDQIPGIGPITATALLARIPDPTLFHRGRDLSAWLGIVPGQHSTGGKERLLGISKHGDRYLRSLLIQGARAVLKTIQHKDDPRSRWLQALAARRHPNVAAVALANKNARVAWAILRYQEDYQASKAAAA
ncbi:IS110 family transposase [Dyella acidisoli]|uniref:Family 20 transposase n=1 Tax=Dyella acidisoli TaxID=1867834 RepID=A0ABQ5XRM8_9GAMM|nr:IS110 family transposase [Dyella acidisoli]GLQ94400.1 putative family 20 transposase [Dyella acidisoli]